MPPGACSSRRRPLFLRALFCRFGFGRHRMAALEAAQGSALHVGDTQGDQSVYACGEEVRGSSRRQRCSVDYHRKRLDRPRWKCLSSDASLSQRSEGSASAHLRDHAADHTWRLVAARSRRPSFGVWRGSAGDEDVRHWFVCMVSCQHVYADPYVGRS